jgi:hypothetical protein
MQIDRNSSSYDVYDPTDDPYSPTFLYHVDSTTSSYQHLAGLGQLAFGPITFGRTSPGPYYSEYTRVPQIAGYAIYDLSSLFFDVDTARFEIDLAPSLLSPRVGKLQIDLIDTLTPQELMDLPLGTLPSEIVSTAPDAPPPPAKTLGSDFNEGRSFSLNQGSGMYEFSLSDPAILAELNRNSGLLAFSFSYTYLDYFYAQPSQVVFNSAPRLMLTGADAASVPVPATLWLFGTALIGLLTIKRNSPTQ